MTSTIYIVDDDPAVAKALAVVGELLNLPVRGYSSGTQFLSSYSSQFTGCLLLDLMLAGESGIDVLRSLQAKRSTLPVIVISGHATVELAVEAMELGAVTVLQKPFRLADLQTKLEDALNRHSAVRSVEQVREVARARLAQLTIREKEVLQLIARGHTNKQMAAELALSVRAVEDRRARLMKRLEAKSIAEVLHVMHQAEVTSEELHSLSLPSD